MNLYRFELTFDGEYQGIGFLTGLDYISLSDIDEEAVLANFYDLKLPCLFKKCQFWFTEAGFIHYALAIRYFQNKIKKSGWDLVYAIRELNPEETTLYQDEFQIATKPTAKESDFKALKDINELILDCPQDFYRFVWQTCDGEELGLFAGLNKLEDCCSVTCMLDQFFDDLPKPDNKDIQDPDFWLSAEFWFTKVGKSYFAEGLDQARDYGTKGGWKLLEKEKRATLRSFKYHDTWQAAWEKKSTQ